MNERTLFLEALDKDDPAQRSAFLDMACAGDDSLRQRVEALLKSAAEAGSFLDKLAPERVAEELALPPAIDETRTQTPDSEKPAEDLRFLTPSDKPNSLGRLGHYDILEVIGRGGMGIVLRAFDENLQRVVAIKVMAAQLATNATARQRFLREARAAAAVSHDHIVTIHAVEEANGLPYLVMQCVAGVSLQQRINRSGHLQLNEILRIGMQTASGLAAAHAQGLIHRDIKPSNILLENGVERIKLTDFGLARAADDASLTQSGVIAGTPQYMSPEQADGKPVDARSDLFSLGSVLYAMCTGRPPFRASSSMAVLKRVCEETATPVREVNPEVPDWLAAVIDRLHAKDPAGRFGSAAEVADVLGRHLAQLQQPGAVLPAAAPLAASRTSPTRRRRWIGVTVALVLLAAGLGGTEATGVTNLRATVIRIFTPDGTLVVEANDPDVKIAVEGNGDLVITGAGVREVRLPPGSYKLRATKDGKPVKLDQELVTITRGDTQVVRVRIEGTAPPATIAPKEEPGAFVVLERSGEEVGTFRTLADAIGRAGGGDVIEIRGNGPFLSPAIATVHGRLTIRAGVGARPVIRWQPETSGILLDSRASLILEGIEFQARIPSQQQSHFTVIHVGSPAGSVRLVNCRIQLSVRNPDVYVGDTEEGISSCCATVALRNCEVVSDSLSGRAIWMYGGTAVRQQLMLDNCFVASANRGYGGLGVANDQAGFPIDVRLTRNTFAGPVACSFGHSANTATRRKLPVPELYRFDCAENVFATSLLFTVFTTGTEALQERKQILAPADARRVFRDLLSWREQRNVYNSTTDFYGIYGANNQRFRSGMDLPHWVDFWGQAKTSSQQGDVHFKGGNLFDLPGGSDAVAADDFRLRERSAGKGIGEGGRDPGADVDLVGPGPAYERWKKTPAYQEWLKESGQKR